MKIKYRWFSANTNSFNRVLLTLPAIFCILELGGELQGDTHLPSPSMGKHVPCEDPAVPAAWWLVEEWHQGTERWQSLHLSVLSGDREKALD